MEELIVVNEDGEDPWIADSRIERDEYTKQIAYVGIEGERLNS